MNPPRRFLPRLLLLLGATAVALLAAEGVARLFSFQTTGRFRDEPWIDTEMYRQVPGRGYEHVPHATPDINALGLRGPERTLEKPPGTFRVLVLGDSVAYGIGVTSDETFAAVLEAFFAKGDERARDCTVEVLNAGVAGYNTQQELSYLTEVGLALAPDLVVLAYCPNDVQSTPIVFLEGDRFVFFRPGLPPRSLNTWLYRNSALVRLVNFNLDRIRVTLGGERSAAGGEDPGGAMDLEGNVSALTTLARLLKERGIPLLTVIFPYLDKPFAEYPPHLLHTHARAAELVRAQGGGVIDLLDSWKFVDHMGLRIARMPDDFVHPNANGHRLAARAIVDWMEQKRLP